MDIEKEGGPLFFIFYFIEKITIFSFFFSFSLSKYIQVKETQKSKFPFFKKYELGDLKKISKPPPINQLKNHPLLRDGKWIIARKQTEGRKKKEKKNRPIIPFPFIFISLSAELC